MWLIQYNKEETGNLHHVTGPRRICRLADHKFHTLKVTLCEFGLGAGLCCPNASILVIVIVIMRPSSLGGGRILRRTLSVRLPVCLSVCPSVPLSLVSRRAT